MSEFFSQLESLHAQLIDPARFQAAVIAVFITAVIGMVLGPSHGNANPWLWMAVDKLFGKIGSRLDRKERKAPDLILRGFIITVFALAGCYALGTGLNTLASRWDFYGVPDAVALSFVLTSGSVWYAVLRLYFAMKEKKVSPGAFYAIARSTRADLSASDDFGITRAGMTLAARSFDKGLVAPVIWYLLFGLPGAFIYAGLAACAWRFGKDGFTKGFGASALALERLLGFIPMIYSGMIMALAGLFTPTGGMTRAFIGQMFGKGKAKYNEGGLPVTAMAYALNVNLGGPAVDMDGSAMTRRWAGPADATARLESGHLRRALYINLMAHLLFVISLLGAMLWAAKG